MNVAATVQGLSKSFGGAVVLDGIDLELPRRQTTAIVGSSGCGKTTLLRLIAGFETPDAGSVDIDGTQVSGPGVFVPAHRREVGFVAQDGALFPHLTVGQNIAYGLPGVRRGGAARRRVAELLETVALDPAFATRRRARTAIARWHRAARLIWPPWPRLLSGWPLSLWPPPRRPSALSGLW